MAGARLRWGVAEGQDNKAPAVGEMSRAKTVTLLSALESGEAARPPAPPTLARRSSRSHTHTHPLPVPLHRKRARTHRHTRTLMPLFQPASRGFAASPLSPGVPLDGTDTVTGLRQLARAAELDRVTGLLDAAGRNGKRGAGARWGAPPPP